MGVGPLRGTGLGLGPLSKFGIGWGLGRGSLGLRPPLGGMGLGRGPSSLGLPPGTLPGTLRGFPGVVAGRSNLVLGLR